MSCVWVVRLPVAGRQEPGRQHVTRQRGIYISSGTDWQGTVSVPHYYTHNALVWTIPIIIVFSIIVR